MARRVASYGSWKSPLTSDKIIADSIRLGGVHLDRGAAYWLESRPETKGRSVLVRYADGERKDLTAAPFNVRTRAHEYGGGSHCLAGDSVVFSNFKDQRLYRVRAGHTPEALTPEAAHRFADARFDARRNRLLAVREDHSEAGQEATSTVVVLDLETREQTVIASGADFYSNPRVSPDGESISWLEWRHPRMPWDGTEVKVLRDGAVVTVAGGESESVFQPQWSPDGRLYFVSDRNGWWNLYRWDGESVEAVLEMEAEFGYPQWVFDWSTYAFESAERAFCTYHVKEGWRLGELDLTKGMLAPIDSPYTDFSNLRAEPGRVVFIAGSPTETSAVVEMDADSKAMRVVRRSDEFDDETRGYFSVPQAIEFAGTDDLPTHAFYYPPHNPDFEAPEDERPPLIVISHGGPTGQTSPTLSLKTQFWTSRGFAVVDINYGGSTGYGRAYRDRLNGRWGIVDLEDCTKAALHLVDQGLADRKKLLIRGGSAGGYTTLAALTFGDVFAAGASYYGVSDLEALANDTHKFESRYMDQMVGPYPEAIDVYRERSPIRHAERLNAPVIFFQGDEDLIVPPDQAERMFRILREKGLPTAYVLFEGEQHGFRKPANVKHALDSELLFYGTVVLEGALVL